MIDLAVGVIIGAAFGKIVDSLVKHMIMPLIGVIMPGEKGYLAWKWVVEGKEVPYGLFLGEVVNFLHRRPGAVHLHRQVSGLGHERQESRRPAGPPPPTKDQELLTEIRDLLKKS